MAVCFTEPELLPIKVLHCGNRDFNLSVLMTLTRLPSLYQRDPYLLKIHWMCKYDLPTSQFSKVIVRQAYRQTQLKLYTTPLREVHGWSKIRAQNQRDFHCEN